MPAWKIFARGNGLLLRKGWDNFLFYITKPAFYAT